MDFIQELKAQTQQALSDLYAIESAEIAFEQTNSNFAGDFTFVVFPFLRYSKKKPEDTASEIGEYLKEKVSEVAGYNVVKGFLNLELSNSYWITVAADLCTQGIQIPSLGDNQKVVVEYSSPNTNKPLHLGHIRNNVLGISICQILEANGYHVVRNNLINDRGVHICKSMIAWQKWGNNETPESTGMKGDHLVGKYYVEFDKHYQKEIASLVAGGMDKDQAKNEAPLMKETRQMLQQWEEGNEEVLTLWKKMNGWVYDGFDVTYKRLGVRFDKIYYESDTYLLGKAMVQEGLAAGVFFKKDDGSVWVDLTSEGLDEKILQRADGTSVYMTQDIGTADLKFKDFGMDKFIYVVGNEQDYHFKVLQLILKKLNKPYADGLYHLSYGMVDLPEGKMKSREGTVVDADELMQEVVDAAKTQTEELGKTEDMDEEELTNLYETLGIGALKYYLLKVDAKKRMMFNPSESIQLQGDTAPFVQYAYTRISSIIRASESTIFELPDSINEEEKSLIVIMNDYPNSVNAAANHYNPSEIANAIYHLAKAFNKFYHEHSILGAKETKTKQFRIALSKAVGETLKHGFSLLGIAMPDRM